VLVAVSNEVVIVGFGASVKIDVGHINNAIQPQLAITCTLQTRTKGSHDVQDS